MRMPANQRGSVVKLVSGYGVRYYDVNGRRCRESGFRTRSAARAFVDSKVEEVAALRRGDPSAVARSEAVTVEEAVRRYLAQHDVDPATTDKLRRQLRHGVATFGPREIGTLRPDELGAWRLTLSEGSRHDVFRALRQVLEQAERWQWIDRNPARYVKNPKPKRPEIQPFASWEELEEIADELHPRFAAIPLFAAGTGLRPEEWIALERRDIDREAAVVTVERVYSQGRLKPCAKTSRQRRRVPLRQRVLDALDALTPRLDSPLLFPAARGGHIDLEKFRGRAWAPGLRAAGVPHRRIYDLRHTYATWSLAAGVDLFTLSRRMGTSLAMIDATYGHLAPDADERERVLLDMYDAGRAESLHETGSSGSGNSTPGGGP
jgi:integrase